MIRALIVRELGDLEAAISDLLQARSLDRTDFDINLNLGRFQFEKGNLLASLIYLRFSEGLAISDAELAQVYFWRAQVLERFDRYDESILTWEALLNLSLDDVPDEWEAIAEEKLIPTATTTPTPTSTPTVTPTFTPTPTETPESSPTPG